MTLPPVLKEDSDETVVIGIVRTSFANLATTGYLSSFILHH
jgi:hypothetical protein